MKDSAIEPASRSQGKNRNRAALKPPYENAQHNSCFNTVWLFNMRNGLCRDRNTLSDPVNHIRKERV